MKQRTIRRIRHLFQAICILGFVMMLGTAGASDAEQIGLMQSIVQGGAGLMMFVGGAWLGGLMS